MNRTIAIALVAFSILAGVTVGVVLQRSQDTPAAAADAGTGQEPRYTGGASTTSGPVTVSDAFLVQSRYGGATFVATLEGPKTVDVRGLSAERDGQELPVAVGADGDSIGSNILRDGPLRLGAAGVDKGTSREATEAFVVHDVEVGQEVRVTIDLEGASDAAFDVPVVVADAVDDVALFEGPPPKITDATLAVFDGEGDATLGWTIVAGGESDSFERSTVDLVTVSTAGGADLGRALEHHTATGGPSGIVALDEPTTTKPVDPAVGGDYDYIDAELVEVGDTLVFRVPFASGVVDVDVKVVAG